MYRRVRKVFCALREHSSVSFAKIATVGGFCDMDIIIVKATAPDDLPLPEKYIHELLKIFSISPTSFHSFSISFARRFSKTHCWKVALKCLFLLHRLIRSLPECSPFRTELLWSRSTGLLSLYPCHFRDDSSSRPEDYTLFIRSYAQLLNEALDCFPLESKATEDEDDDEEQMAQSLQEKMKQVGVMLEVLPQLQSLIDRVMDCRPTGAATRSFIVQSAMKHIIRDSFNCYTTFRREIVLVLDNLLQMPYRSCVLAFEIYKKAALQADQLCEFYDWCKATGLYGSYEYHFIDRIPQIQIRALETFLNGMWQLTESSSSTTSPSSGVGSKSSSTEDDGEKQIVKKEIVVSTQWENFEENDFPRKLKGNEQMEPLIRLEDDDWEALLDASINLSWIHRRDLFIYPNSFSNHCEHFYGCDSNGFGYGHGHGHGHEVYAKDTRAEGNNQWQMQVYNPNAFDPFCQPYYMPNGNGSFAGLPANPWGF